MFRRVPVAMSGAAALLSTALMLGACSSSAGSAGGSSGHASGPTSTAAAAPVTAAALGDLATFDPCSVADPRAFGASAAATFGDPQSLDYCVLELSSPDGPVEVHVGEIAAVPGSSAGDGATSARGTVQLPGGVRLEQGAPGSTGCKDKLVLSGGLGVLASAIPAGGATASAATCAVADTAARAAVADLAAGQARHRTDPATSYGQIDACTVLTRSMVRAVVPKLADAAPISHPARHYCEYGASGDSSTYAALVLGAAYARFDGGPTSTTLTLSGHEVVLIPEQPDARAGECVGYGPHVPFPSRSGQAAMEMAELHVALPAGSSDTAACAEVGALARSVFARLP